MRVGGNDTTTLYPAGGTTGQTLTVDGSGDLAWQSAGTNSTGIFVPSSSYFIACKPNAAQSSTALAMTANASTYYPYFFSRQTTVASLSVQYSSATAGTNIWLGVAVIMPDLSGGALLNLNSATTSTGAGVATVALPCTVGLGWYYLTVGIQGSALNLLGPGPGGSLQVPWSTTLGPSAANPVVSHMYYGNGVPASPAALTPVQGANGVPAIYLSCSA